MAPTAAETQTTRAASIVASEAAHFDGLAADWWDPAGSSAMLHRLGPARLRYLRSRIDAHWDGDGTARRPFAGRRAIDVGCGAGLLSEPLARLGADVTGVDAAARNVAVAAEHAAAQGLAIAYRHGDIADRDFAAALGQYDLVVSMEVIEHVEDAAAFLQALTGLLAPGGLMILSTPNRTLASRLLLVGAAEYSGAVPKGTHDWRRFITPAELTGLAAANGLVVADVSGLAPDPSTRGFRTGGTTLLNYLMTLRR